MTRSRSHSRPRRRRRRLYGVVRNVVVAFAANVTPLRLFQQDTRVYTALLRGFYIIRSWLESNIMNHASCLGRV